MPPIIKVLLNSNWFPVLARVVLTIVFWSAGLTGIFNFSAKVQELRFVGLATAEYMLPPSPWFSSEVPAL